MDESLLKKPAKDLTDAEAFDVLMYLYEQGKNQGPYGSSAYTDGNPLRIKTTRLVDGQYVEFDY